MSNDKSKTEIKTLYCVQRYAHNSGSISYTKTFEDKDAALQAIHYGRQLALKRSENSHQQYALYIEKHTIETTAWNPSDSEIEKGAYRREAATLSADILNILLSSLGLCAYKNKKWWDSNTGTSDGSYIEYRSIVEDALLERGVSILEKYQKRHAELYAQRNFQGVDHARMFAFANFLIAELLGISNLDPDIPSVWKDAKLGEILKIKKENRPLAMEKVYEDTLQWVGRVLLERVDDYPPTVGEQAVDKQARVKENRGQLLDYIFYQLGYNATDPYSVQRLVENHFSDIVNKRLF